MTTPENTECSSQIEAYSFFPPLSIPRATENATGIFVAFEVGAGNERTLAWKYYQRYPERRVTRLNPAINNFASGRRWRFLSQHGWPMDETSTLSTWRSSISTPGFHILLRFYLVRASRRIPVRSYGFRWMCRHLYQTPRSISCFTSSMKSRKWAGFTLCERGTPVSGTPSSLLPALRRTTTSELISSESKSSLRWTPSLGPLLGSGKRQLCAA